MSKNRKEEKTGLLDVKRDGDYVTMTVRLESGFKERWTYERSVGEYSRGCVSYSMIDREDVR